MSSSRVIYQNWIADLGRDPAVPVDPDSPDELTGQTETRVDEIECSAVRPLDPQESQRVERIREAVVEALSRLNENEREVVEQFHLMGRTYREIAELSGRTPHRLEALHERAVKKLRKLLAPLVKELYGLGSGSEVECPICSSPRRSEIDRLITERDQEKTWRPVMRRIKTAFGLKITTPQTLIGHQKYH